MHSINLTISDETAKVLQEMSGDIDQGIRLLAAMKLYELGHLSSGAAAELAGIPRTLFLGQLERYGVNTFCLTEAELIDDLTHA